MSVKIGKIYIHKNIHDGKIYIGQTWQDPERRWRKNCKKYRSYINTIAFYNALCAHTWDSFHSEVLCYCQTQEDLDRTEEYFIKYYDCLAPKGYNLRSICEGREKHTEETKDKIRQKAMGRKGNCKPKHMPYEFEGKLHRKCYKCLKGKSLETSFYKCKLRKDRQHTDNHDQWCKECRKQYRNENYQYQRMEESKKQESFKARGKLWKELYDTPEHRQIIKERVQKPVLQIDPKTNTIVKEWAAAKEASPSGFKPTGISVACNTHNHQYKGFLWKFKV